MLDMIELQGGGAPENSSLRGKEAGFTLAEVLITLGIIGIVAALTFPSIIGYYQKKVLQEQFKVAYSMFSQLLLKSEVDLGGKAECYYWDVNPYGPVICVEYDEKGVCKKQTLADGSPMPSNFNGNMSECKVLLDNILSNVEIISKCEGKAYEKGCIPEYKGFDTVKQVNDPDMTDDEAYAESATCPNLRKNAILNDRTVYVFKNGIIFMPYSPGIPIYVVDINGKKSPNKWGYDLFAFRIMSNNFKPLKLSGEVGCFVTEKGGVTAKEMIENIYSKK